MYDDEQIQFFPAAFLFYILCVILACILISIKLSEHNGSSFSFWSNIQKQYAFPSYSLSDFILVFSVMLINLFESLLSFHRYYLTSMSTQFFKLINALSVFPKFAYYALPFTILYIISMLIYFWCFPLVILLHAVANMYWDWKFASILITKYSLFEDIDKSILDSVHFMKNTSLLSSAVQIIYLLLFMLYNTKCIVLLPLLWFLSILISSLIFARNRKVIYAPFLKLVSFCKRKLNSRAAEPSLKVPVMKDDLSMYSVYAVAMTFLLFHRDELPNVPVAICACGISFTRKKTKSI